MSYWATVPEMEPFDELKLSLLWRERWTAAGWEPFVLNEWHARQHPMFSEFDRAISALPAVNPFLYERACFLRWMALAKIGGGFMSDFDLIPYPSKETEIHTLIVKDCDPIDYLGDVRLLEGRLQMFQRVSPSLVQASKEVCEQLCIQMMSGQFGKRDINGRTHFSDMYAIDDIGLKFPDLIERHDIVKGYADDHWETAPFVHWSNGSMSPRGKTPRYKHIPLLRPFT